MLNHLITASKMFVCTIGISALIILFVRVFWSIFEQIWDNFNNRTANILSGAFLLIISFLFCFGVTFIIK